MTAPRRPATTEPPDAPASDADQEDEPETGPQRRCVVTRERLPKERMIRFVVMAQPGPAEPEGTKRGGGRIVPDLTATLPGRGIWLSARRDVIETARTRGAFAKAARAHVTISPDLTTDLQAALTRRVVETLGLARRAGQVVCGFAKAREWLAAGRAALVVQARDGSADERQRFLGGWTGRVAVVTPLDGAALGAAFGREHVVHVVVSPGRLAERLRVEAERLAGIRDAVLPALTPSPPFESGNGDAGRRPGKGGAGRRENKAIPSGAAGQE